MEKKEILISSVVAIACGAIASIQDVKFGAFVFAWSGIATMLIQHYAKNRKIAF